MQLIVMIAKAVYLNDCKKQFSIKMNHEMHKKRGKIEKKADQILNLSNTQNVINKILQIDLDITCDCFVRIFVYK